MKLVDARASLVEAATAGMKRIKGVEKFDALKPEIVAAVEEIAGVLVKLVGEYDMSPVHFDDTARLLAMISGMLSGSLIKIRLTADEVDEVVAATKLTQREEMEKTILERMRALDAAVSPRDMN